jgi:hypothetical protein
VDTNTLLEPGNHALLLIDHQYLQLLTLRSHEGSQVITNATAVAKAAKIFDVPILLATAFAERQNLIKEIQDVVYEQTPLDRSTLNSWEDGRIVDWVKETGKKKLRQTEPLVLERPFGWSIAQPRHADAAREPTLDGSLDQTGRDKGSRWRRCRSPTTTTWSRQSGRIEPIALSQYPFCHGDRGAVGRSRMPIARRAADEDVTIDGGHGRCIAAPLSSHRPR